MKISKLDIVIDTDIKEDFAKACRARGQSMTWVLTNLVQQFIKARNYESKKARSKNKTAPAPN